MDLDLYVKEGKKIKVLKTPVSVIKDLLRDRLCKSEIERIHRLAEETLMPESFRAGSVLVDFSNKTASLFQSGINVEYLEPTWDVKVEKMTLNNY